MFPHGFGNVFWLGGKSSELAGANLPVLGANLPKDKESKARFPQFDSAHFEWFCKAFGEVFGNILVSFTVVTCTMNF